MARAPTPVAIRIPSDQLRRIDQRARKLGLSRTQLLIRGALSELDEPDRLAQIERRLRRTLTRPLRARLEQRLPELEAEAQRRGVDTSGWRAYPGPDGWLGDLVNDVEELPRGRKRKPAPKPSPTDAGSLLDALERSLQQGPAS
jgi:hypothetical protein